ncbi:MAG: ATP-grasp domain-containing protein [Rhodobacteraceae bacterium]|nr:MAG: ATP-grasp domain-containing protein [Paracoccaceae bacterium]
MSQPQTILVLGTNAGQADLIRYMKRRGWRVVACAHRAGGPGEALCDHFALVDVRDVAAVTALAREVGADLVYSVSSDIANTSAVAVSEALGLPHFFHSDLVDLFNNKHRLRAHLNAKGLGPVGFRVIAPQHGAADWQSFPCMVKPANSQGQRGVQRVDRPEDLTAAIRQAASGSMTDGTVILEDFLDGVEVCCNTLVRDGLVVVHEVSERLVNAGALACISRGHLIPPCNVTQAELAATHELVRAVVASLDLREGCLYFQIKITRDGPRIVEIAPRVDGGHLWRLMSFACGIDFLDETMKCLLGEPCTVDRRAPDAMHEMIFFQMPPGTAFRQAAFPAPAGALYHEYRYGEGETVLPVNGQWEVVGYYVRPLTADQAAGHAAEGTGRAV